MINIEEISIHIHTGVRGFWSEITEATTGKPVTIWEQVETSDDIQEAFDRAVNARDKLIAAEMEEAAAENAAQEAEERRGMGLPPIRQPREYFKDE